MMNSRAVVAMAAGVLTIGAMALPVHAAEHVGDIFVIALENHDGYHPASYTRTQAVYTSKYTPYIRSLITPGNPNSKQTAYATHFYNIQHPSEPNYIWTEAGTNLGINNDRDPFPHNEREAQHLTGLMQAAGMYWKSYQEDIDLNPKNGAPLPRDQWTVPLKSISGKINLGFPPNVFNGSRRFSYAAKHDPEVFFVDTSGGDDLTPANPEVSHYAPMWQLKEDLKNNTVGRFNWITPDQYNEMHSPLPEGFDGLHGDPAQVAAGDHCLSILIPEIQKSKAYKDNGVIIIWCDETAGGDTHDFTLPYIVISPLARGNAYACDTPMNHLSDLRTFQEIFQLRGDTPTGFLGGAANVVDQSEMFKPGVIPQSLPKENTIERERESAMTR